MDQKDLLPCSFIETELAMLALPLEKMPPVEKVLWRSALYSIQVARMEVNGLLDILEKLGREVGIFEGEFEREIVLWRKKYQKLRSFQNGKIHD